MADGFTGPEPTRRTFLRAGMSNPTGPAPAKDPLSATAAAPRPNFVVILGEGMRADELSSAGNKLISTPNLDRIAREGISFRNSFVINALCLPARATVLTGLYSHSNGCIDNKNREIPKDVPMFADTLREAGYEVGFFGKSHIQALSKRYWDAYLGIEAALTDYYHPVMIKSEKGQAEPARPYQGYVDDLITDRALAWLTQERNKPFCLFLWFMAPHDPFFRPRRLLDLYNGVEIPKPATFDDDLKGYPGKPRAFTKAWTKIGTTVPVKGAPRSLEELVKDHYAGVVGNDDNVGRVLEALTRLGKLDDTVIVLNSDHGFFLGEWGFYNKMFMHEPSIRVPLAVRYPRLIRPGEASEKMALNLDITPTLLELAGLKVPEWMQGRSLVPFMKGVPPSDWRQDWLYEYYDDRCAPKNRGVRTERYKLIHYWEAPQEFELYDLQEDPGELHNLYGDASSKELTKDLLHRMEELRRETGEI
jgi:arylsulfatase A-like enzyme